MQLDAEAPRDLEAHAEAEEVVAADFGLPGCPIPLPSRGDSSGGGGGGILPRPGKTIALVPANGCVNICTAKKE